jgi:hypothetical protein
MIWSMSYRWKRRIAIPIAAGISHRLTMVATSHTTPVSRWLKPVGLSAAQVPMASSAA